MSEEMLEVRRFSHENHELVGVGRRSSVVVFESGGDMALAQGILDSFNQGDLLDVVAGTEKDIARLPFLLAGHLSSRPERGFALVLSDMPVQQVHKVSGLMAESGLGERVMVLDTREEVVQELKGDNTFMMSGAIVHHTNQPTGMLPANKESWMRLRGFVAMQRQPFVHRIHSSGAAEAFIDFVGHLHQKLGVLGVVSPDVEGLKALVVAGMIADRNRYVPIWAASNPELADYTEQKLQLIGRESRVINFNTPRNHSGGLQAEVKDILGTLPSKAVSLKQ